MLLGDRTETVEVMEQTGLLHRITSCGRRAAAQLSIDGSQTPDIDQVVITKGDCAVFGVNRSKDWLCRCRWWWRAK